MTSSEQLHMGLSIPPASTVAIAQSGFLPATWAEWGAIAAIVWIIVQAGFFLYDRWKNRNK